MVPLLLSCSAQERTREEVLQNVRMASAETLANMEVITVEVNGASPSATSNPWLETAGMFQNDPLFDDMLAEVAAYRRAWNDQHP